MAEPRPLRADARRNREKILRAARDAFAASGFDVPLDEISARAGVGPGTVYRHFPSKEALFEAVITARMRDIADDARRRADNEDAGAAFFGFLARIGEEAAAKRDMPDAIATPGPLREEIFAAMDVLLRRAQRAGAVRADATTPDLISLLKALLLSLRETPAEETAEARRKLLFGIVTEGLRGTAGLWQGAGSCGTRKRAGVIYVRMHRQIRRDEQWTSPARKR